jgi:Dyp-type peroxidase family
MASAALIPRGLLWAPLRRAVEARVRPLGSAFSQLCTRSVESFVAVRDELQRRFGTVVPPPPLEPDDTQGLLFRGYGGLRHCCYVLLQVRDAREARRWLAGLVDQVTSGARSGETGRATADVAVQVALTHRGFAALGLPAEALQGFSAEFIGGMVGSHRSRLLGDVGDSAPSGWSWGGPNNPTVHVALMLYATSAERLEQLRLEHKQRWSLDGMVDIHTVHTAELSEREHFGFADGISQPAIEGYHTPSSELHLVKAGEFILGYPNEYGLLADRPLVNDGEESSVLPMDVAGSGRRDFGRNGTYLVMRQLRQDVGAFRETIERLTRHPDGSSDPEARELLAARMVGRWPSGTSLIDSPWQDEASKARKNDFRYHRPDPHGLQCPIGAHVRRTNPRDSLPPKPGTSESLAVNRRHRLLRRGRAYGPELAPGAVDPPGQPVERGLIFIALNANIGRQFEFVQSSWMLNPRFGGLSDESDPIAGAQDDNRLSIPGNPVRTRCAGLPRFVTVAGGAYLFLPSLRALRYLASRSTTAEDT